MLPKARKVDGRGRRGNRISRPQRGTVVLIAMWVLGLSMLAAVLILQARLDHRRQAQVAVAGLRNQMTELPRIALDLNQRFTLAQVQAQLATAQAEITETAATLNSLAGSRRDSELIMTRARVVFAVVAQVNLLSHSGGILAAAAIMSRASGPGGPAEAVTAVFNQISLESDREAASARRLVEIGSVLAVVAVLLAFSVVLHRTTGLARERQQLLQRSREDALTDQLTGLPNRRKLFIDMEEILRERRTDATLTLGMFDLDGFKAYNDTYGHPAGDALLARVGKKLIVAVEGLGSAYRMGGDEFCVITRGADAESVLEASRTALSESGDSYAIRCSLGSILVAAGETTFEEALRQADGRLYRDKRSARAGEPMGESTLFVLAERDGGPLTPLAV